MQVWGRWGVLGGSMAWVCFGGWRMEPTLWCLCPVQHWEAVAVAMRAFSAFSPLNLQWHLVLSPILPHCTHKTPFPNSPGAHYAKHFITTSMSLSGIKIIGVKMLYFPALSGHFSKLLLLLPSSLLIHCDIKERNTSAFL